MGIIDGDHYSGDHYSEHQNEQGSWVKIWTFQSIENNTGMRNGTASIKRYFTHIGAAQTNITKFGTGG